MLTQSRLKDSRVSFYDRDVEGRSPHTAFANELFFEHCRLYIADFRMWLRYRPCALGPGLAQCLTYRVASGLHGLFDE